MISCRICLEEAKNPASLPCGHIFCTNCIVNTIRAVKHFTNLHPCPICRSIYNIAPVNLKVVPPNLRPFVTPSIRRLYIQPHSPDEQDSPDEKQAPIASTSSEISRLQAENQALRNHCITLGRRVQIHGSANLNLIKLAYIMRDQASYFARERDELEMDCARLKRKLDDDESLTRGNATSCTGSGRPAKIESLETSSVPFSLSPTLLPPCSPSGHPIDGSVPPRKRLRIDSLTQTQPIQCTRSVAAKRIAIWQKEVSDSMSLP